MADESVASELGKSKYRGVAWYAGTCEWQSSIVAKDGETKLVIGYFHTEERAARVHDFAVQYLQTGESLNFPNEKSPMSIVRAIRPKLFAFKRSCVKLMKEGSDQK